MFVLNENVEFDRLGDEPFLHLSSGAPLALNVTGILVVQGIIGGLCVQKIAQFLVERCGLGLETASGDIAQFMELLHVCGAIREDGSPRCARCIGF